MPLNVDFSGMQLQALMLHSIEGFVSAHEIAAIDAHLAAAFPCTTDYEVPHRQSSIHVVDGLSVQQAARVYEPAGRVEVTKLPDAVLQLLDRTTTKSAFDTAPLPIGHASR